MQRGPVIVRPVELSDAADVRENCFSTNTLEEVESRIEANLRAVERRSGIQLVAEVRGMVVGTVGLTRNPSPIPAHRAELDSLVVHPSVQRQGIGRELVAASCVCAQSMGVDILEVSCRAGTAAEKVYARLGFIEYGRLPRGMLEPWGDHKAFDQVFLYRPVADASVE